MASPARIDPRHLRPVLTFALDVAREPRVAGIAPNSLKPFLRRKRVPAAELGALARAVAGDPTFFRVLATAAEQPEVADAVGEIGVLWLTRPAGWEARIVELAEADARARAEAVTRVELERSEKRRERAESARNRAVAELAGARAEADGLRRQLAQAERQLAGLHAELATVRAELEGARKEARSAGQRAESAHHRIAELVAELDQLRSQRAAGDADRPGAPALSERHQGALTDLTKAACELADRLADLARELVAPQLPAGSPRPATRVPLVRPGGVRAGTPEEAVFLLKSGAAVLIDGYNVAKQAWPGLDLPEQRERLILHSEEVARRYGADITIVFDGAEVTGASTNARRAVRVLYSPPGVIADDVIRTEVARIPAARPVVVVTDDREVVRDVRADGANTIPSLVYARRTV